MMDKSPIMKTVGLDVVTAQEIQRDADHIYYTKELTGEELRAEIEEVVVNFADWYAYRKSGRSELGYPDSSARQDALNKTVTAILRISSKSNL
ncbi:MAG: hypothetical protein PHQ86_09285 [Dehalococcoidales bacterium]|nr:hypothetical protein [Dehalococcoidales bacterium]